MAARHVETMLGLLLAAAAGTAVAVQIDGPPTGTPPKENRVPAAKATELSALVARLSAEGWETREKAMRDLIALGEAARPVLREARRSQDPEVRWRATYALSLLELALEPIESDAARTLYASAARARAQEGGKEAACQLYAEVVERFPDSRWAAAARERLTALRAEKPPAPKAPPTAEAVAQLVTQLGDSSWAKRQAASQSLAQLGEAARAALEAAAQGPDPEVAWRARSLLGRLQADPAVPEPRAAGRGVKITVELPGEGIRTRPGAAEPNDLDALVRSLSHEDSREISRARESLLNVGEDAIAPLLRGLDACDEATGVEIMDLLRQITREGLGFDPQRWQAWWRARQERGKD